MKFLFYIKNDIRILGFIIVFSLMLIGMPLDGGVGDFDSYENTLDSRYEAAQDKGKSFLVGFYWMIIYLYAVSFFVLNWDRFAFLIFPIYGIGLLLVAGLSFLWSEDPFNTVVLFGQIIGGVAFCCLVVVWIQFNKVLFLKRLTNWLMLLALVNSMLCLFVSEIAVNPFGRWVGLYGSPNYFAHINILLLFFLLWRTAVAGFDRYVIFGVVLCAVNIIMSNSVTSIVAVFFGLFVFLGMLSIYSKLNFLLITSFAIAIIFSFSIMFDLDVFFVIEFFGRDIGMSGRDLIWSEALNHISLHPILGYGLADIHFSSYLPFITDPHNSYYSVMLKLGLVGVVLCLFLLMISIWNVFAKCDNVDAKFFTAGMIFSIIIGYSESYVFSPRSPIFILFIILIVMAHKLKFVVKY